MGYCVQYVVEKVKSFGVFLYVRYDTSLTIRRVAVYDTNFNKITTTFITIFRVVDRLTVTGRTLGFLSLESRSSRPPVFSSSVVR